MKSDVSRNPEVAWQSEVYRLQAVARGKELKVTLCDGEVQKTGEKTLDIVFRFGMSGTFKFTTVDELPKHSHLRFFTISEEIPMVLSFVDQRRFGRWEVGGTWGFDRGPDPMWEYQSFRENVITSLHSPAFNKPICEAMLNQKYFNGIGNYLRAEILFRCSIRPFDEAREVLSELKPVSKWYEAQTKQKSGNKSEMNPDILDFCHIVPKEVIHLSGGGKGYNVDPDADDNEYKEFRAWLRCYNQDGMRNMVDHNGRTMWFSGNPGRLIPKDVSSRGKVERKRMKSNSLNENVEEDERSEPEKKLSMTKQEKTRNKKENTINSHKTSKKHKVLKNESDREKSISKPERKRRNSKFKLPESAPATNSNKEEATDTTASQTARQPTTCTAPTRRSSRQKKIK